MHTLSLIYSTGLERSRQQLIDLCSYQHWYTNSLKKTLTFFHQLTYPNSRSCSTVFSSSVRPTYARDA